MPRKVLPRIQAVAPGEQPMTLCVRWDNGVESLLDVSGMIQGIRVYQPLRSSLELFRQVRVGEHGTDIVWTDEIDMSADTLWRVAQEQKGETMTPDAFRNWRERKAYTLDRAARALGLSRRIVAYYEKGDRPVPRVVALATRALDIARAAATCGHRRDSWQLALAGAPPQKKIDQPCRHPGGGRDLSGQVGVDGPSGTDVPDCESAKRTARGAVQMTIIRIGLDTSKQSPPSRPCCSPQASSSPGAISRTSARFFTC